MGALDYLQLGTKRPLRVAAYCRVSFEEEKDGSFETQRNYFKEAIKEHPDWKSAGIFADYAKTGTKVRGRDDYQRMMRHAEAGSIDYIITKSISRFSRSATTTLAALRKLKTLGVGVYFLEQGLDTRNSLGELILTILATIAEMESNSISQNTKMSFDAMNAKGTPLRKCSYGYCRKGLDWVVIPDKMTRVKLAYLMAANGFGLTAIAKRLNEFEKFDRSGRVWDIHMVRRTLLSETYVGDILTNKHVNVYQSGERREVENNGDYDQFYIEGHHQAVVDRKLWAKIVDMIEKKELAGQENYKGVDAVRVLARRDRHLDEVRRWLPPVKRTKTKTKPANFAVQG